MKTLHLILIVTLALPAIVRADQAPSLELPFAIGENAIAVAPTRAAETMALPASNTLEEARLGAADKLAAMKAWNAAGRLPTQNGFTRVLKAPLRAELGAPSSSQAAPERWIVSTVANAAAWSTRLKVLHSYRLRLHIENITAPVGTIFTVWSAASPPRAFGFDLRGPGGDIWTPSVAGEDVYLEARAPADAGQVKGGFEIRELVELIAAVPVDNSCIVDASCITAGTYSPLATVRKGIAQLFFIEGSDAFVCSGGLLNDTDTSTVIPYLLTANHCISTPAVATTLEAHWDDKTASCGGVPPNLNTLPSSSGATLLATSVQSDFCLLRLNSIPSGRTLLGWHSTALVNGVTVSRISHPCVGGNPCTTILPQSFSQTLFTTGPAGICDTDSDGRPWGDLTKFHYSTPLTGGIAGGSSGSPLLDSTGRVVGQLLGTCGPPGGDGCDPDTYVVDGSFSATYPFISQFLSPTVTTGPCVRSATTACLQSNRFEIKVTFTNDSSSGNATAMDFGGQRAETNESAFYYFTSATNFEMGLKVLNACIPALGNKFWVFISGLTDQGWHATVRDTQTGVSKSYSNTNHHLTTTTADTAAFDCP